MAAQVHAQHGVPVVVGEVEQNLVADEAGVVDHHVQTTEVFDRRRQQCVGRPTFADVPGHGDGLAAAFLDGVHRVVCVVGGHVGDHDPCPDSPPVTSIPTALD